MLAAGLLAGAPSARGEAAGEGRERAAIRAADLVDFIGVNTHVAYTDSRYADARKVVEALGYIGVTRVRDSIPNPSLPGNGWYNYPTLAQAGIRFNLVAGGNDVDLKATVERLEQLEQRAPGAVAAVEGPNEYNNWPFPFEGRTGNDAAVAFQNGLDARLRGSRLLDRVPFYNLTTWPPAFGRYDLLTVHIYPKHGEQPRAVMAHEVRKFAHDGRFFPASLTEIGYYTLQKKIGWGGVDDVTQARLTLNTLLVAKQMGFASVYLYELLDAYPDPGNTEVERHFGLFSSDYAPKPAATALRRLTAALADPGEDRHRFAPARRRYTLETEGAFDILACEKSTRETVLVVWDERPVWDADALAPRPVPEQPVRLVLGEARQVLSVTDLVTGEALPAPPQPSDGLTLPMRGNPVAVVVR
ncbi:hypothetical protein OPKNFCMD_5542 [Methylobacterium crusticola]|uniref:Calcium-binding protein n=1 Tax=Methylobacterium crusticola TaxID=1697972 RepID=A0ABQ4R6I6_9HYPH|nr:hypothetical protein [Methylobacterium crusticola]GJD52775.1 hypothetical protein OPKNFCMD_5542 [Methylobacterium crusticola]